MQTMDRTIAEHQVRARGWQLDYHQHGDGLSYQSFYLFHYNTAKLDLITLPVDLCEPPTQQLHDPIEAGSLLAAAYRKFIKIGSGRQSNTLGYAVMQYLMCTQSWQQLQSALRQEPTAKCHPIFVLYGLKRDLRVRPVIGRSERRIEEPEWVLELCREVYESDRQRHPEWFA